MARHKKGVMGAFFGKVGTVVGGEWRGVRYMRSLPEYKKNRGFTDKQLLQMARFKLATGFIKNIAELVNVTYQPVIGQTGRNGALSHTIRQAIDGDINNLSINYANVVVASGGLRKASSPTASSNTPGILDFQWQFSASSVNRAADKAILVAYCPELEDVWFTLEGATRDSMQAQLQVPFFSGKTVHTWLSFINPDGSQVADSVYTGEIVVA